MKADIEDLMARSGADEAVLLTITPSFEDRVRSYELIADVFAVGRKPAAPPSPPTMQK